MLVVGLVLQMHFVVLLKVASVEDLKVEGNRLASVDAAEVPRVGLADSDLGLCVVRRLLFQRSNLAYCSCNFDFFRASG